MKRQVKHHRRVKPQCEICKRRPTLIEQLHIPDEEDENKIHTVHICLRCWASVVALVRQSIAPQIQSLEARITELERSYTS